MRSLNDIKKWNKSRYASPSIIFGVADSLMLDDSLQCSLLKADNSGS